MRLIKTLRNNSKVVFDIGIFDDWCVYIIEEDNGKYAPKDIEYFTELKNISLHYSKNKVYNNFVKIYDLTTKNIDEDVLKLIDRITLTYNGEHQDSIEKWFTVIYAGMVAEENKANAILKKRIKRLGMYQVLILDNSPEYAAKFSYGKKWRKLDQLMRKYGF